MRTAARVAVAVAVFTVLASASIAAFRAHHRRVAGDIAAVQRLDQDVRAADVLQALRTEARTGRLAFVNVNVVDPVAGAIVRAQTVVVRGDRIEWVGAASEAPPLDDAIAIDGTGRYLSPGLADMHVHTEYLGQHLLRLAAGVTSVRDMDGFPWLLRTRDAINSGRMIGATTYVAGTIIADQPLDGYAVVVHTPEQARQVVQNQAACGYSFIKVHNSLSEPLFDAVAEETHRLGLDLVGHVPHGITLRHAIQSGHMRTLEHLKGFLVDQTLLPSDEPYAPALAGAEVWLTPSLYTRIASVHGDEARQRASDPRQRFNPRERRDEWSAGIPAEGSHDAMLHDRLVRTQATVMARLLPLHPHWLVGTDAAGYPFNIAGFAALDELVLLHQAGLSNREIVRAATVEAAVALRLPNEFGRVTPGMRADLILLAADPFDDVAAYQANLGVMARGRWYDRAALDAALDRLAHVYDEPLPTAIDPVIALALARHAQARAANGDVFEDAALTAAADALGRAGVPAGSRVLRSLVSAPASGACAAVTPE